MRTTIAVLLQYDHVTVLWSFMLDAGSCISVYEMCTLNRAAVSGPSKSADQVISVI